MITIQISGNLEEIKSQLNELQQIYNPELAPYKAGQLELVEFVEEEVQEPPPKKKRGAKPKVEEALVVGEITPHPESCGQLEEAPLPVEKIYTKENVVEALKAVSEKFGIAKCKEILTEFDAQRVPDIKEEQFAKFVERCLVVTQG